MYQIGEYEGQRYVGESDRAVVHDTWHPECEDCLVEDMVGRGVAVGFEPDDLEQALWEGFEYCEYCFDRASPVAPHRKVGLERVSRG